MEVKFSNTFNYETRNGFPDIYCSTFQFCSYRLCMYDDPISYSHSYFFLVFPIAIFMNIQMYHVMPKSSPPINYILSSGITIYFIFCIQSLVYVKSIKCAFIPKVNKTLKLMSPAFLSKAVTYNELLYFVIVYLYLKD